MRLSQAPRLCVFQVGVGGSGKQSLAKLAAFICGYEVFQISVTSTYGAAEFKADLVQLYTRTGVKSVPTVFLMTDGQIVAETFLVYLNDLLSSGYIPDLFTQEEKDTICNSLRNEVKQVKPQYRCPSENPLLKGIK
jgi:dynein heavy chain